MLLITGIFCTAENVLLNFLRYFINLFLNFNIAFPAALLGMGLCPEVGVWFSIPFALLFLFFSFMPHKEERFFFIGFPLLCVLAASFFDTQGSRKRIISRKNRVGVIKRKVVHGNTLLSINSSRLLHNWVLLI